MTETEARKQYKREWARRNRAKMKESEKRFYEKKAAEYAETGESDGQAKREKMKAVMSEIDRLDKEIEKANAQRMVAENLYNSLMEKRRKLYTEHSKMAGYILAVR